MPRIPVAAALFVAAAVIAGSPLRARAEIQITGASASLETLVQDARVGANFDRDTDGSSDPAELASFERTVESSLGQPDAELRSTATIRTRVTLGADGGQIRGLGRYEIEHDFVNAADRQNMDSTALAGFNVAFCITEPMSFSVSGSGRLEGSNETYRFEGEGSKRFNFVFGTASGGLSAAPGGGFGAQTPGGSASASGSEQGELEVGCYSFGAGLNGRLFSPIRQFVIGNPPFPPETRGTFSAALTLGPTGPDEGNLFRWVGPAEGAFGDEGNWEDESGNAGVPSFVSFEDADTALVDASGDVTLQFGSGLARALVPRGVGPRIGRLVARESGTLRPVFGSLSVDSLSPELGSRSLEVGTRKTLVVEDFDLEARHAIVGQNGEGTLEVVGADGLLTTSGRLGLGGNAPGTLRIRDGGTVITEADTLIGEEAEGSATIEGPASTWNTGNLAVGHHGPGELTLTDGGRVASLAGFVDFELAGAERAKVVVEGLTFDPASPPAEWQLEELNVGGRGSVELTDDGQVSVISGPGLLQIGGAAPADCGDGAGCVDVDHGTLQANQIAVGIAGDGELQVGPEGTVIDFGELGAGFAGSLGAVTLFGPSSEPQLIASALQLGVEPGGHAEFALVDGAHATVGAVRAGLDCGEPGCGRIELLDGALNLLEVLGEVRLGAALPPTEATALPTGVLQIEDDAEVRVQATSAPPLDGDFIVGARGRIEGLGRVSVEGALVNDGFIGCGIRVVGAFVAGPLGVVECPGVGGAPRAPQLNPLAASRFARVLRKRPPPTPLPPAGPFVVDGDASLGGSLVLQFRAGAAPRLGDSFELLDVSGAVTGSFSQVVVRGLAPGASFAEDLVDGKLTLTSLTDAKPLPAVSLKAKSLLKERKFKKGTKVKFVRKGDKSEPLTVRYAVRGSARNRFDYEGLSGVIEIPARKKSAKLVVRPIPDGLAEPTETIELEVLAGDGYAPGLVSKATIALESEE